MWSLHALRGLFRGSSFFLPQFKDTHIRLMGNYKLPVGVRIVDGQPTANAGNNYV